MLQIRMCIIYRTIFNIYSRKPFHLPIRTSDLLRTISISVAPCLTAYSISWIRASMGVWPAGKPPATIELMGVWPVGKPTATIELMGVWPAGKPPATIELMGVWPAGKPPATIELISITITTISQMYYYLILLIISFIWEEISSSYYN